MKALVGLVGLLATCVGCNGTDPGVDPNAIALNRRYDLSSCVPADCPDYQPHGAGRVDSAHLVLRPDHTGEWMYAASGTVNPCYIEQKDCTTPYKYVQIHTGSYSFGHDTLYFHFSGLGVELFTGGVSVRVSTAWSGPDSLVRLFPYPRIVLR